MTYLAYHNDPDIKTSRVRQANWHKEQDLIAQGAYYNANTHQTCNTGCSLPREVLESEAYLDNPHKEQAKHTGIAPVLSHFHEKLFEGTKKGCIEFAPRVLETLQIGADTERISWTFIYELLSSELIQQALKKSDFEQHRKTIKSVRKVFYNGLITGEIDKTAAYHAVTVARSDRAAAYTNFAATRATFGLPYATRIAADVACAITYATFAAAYAAYRSACNIPYATYASRIIADVALAAASVTNTVEVYIAMRTMLLDIQANWDVTTQQYTQLTPLNPTL